MFDSLPTYILYSFSKLYIFMFSPMFDIILEIEFQCSYNFYLQGFSWISFYCNLSFRQNKIVRMKLQKINIRFEIHKVPTLYMQYLFGLKYDRQLTAWQHHGPKIDPTCFRRCKMGWVPFFICFFSRKTTNHKCCNKISWSLNLI